MKNVDIVILQKNSVDSKIKNVFYDKSGNELTKKPGFVFAQKTTDNKETIRRIRVGKGLKILNPYVERVNEKSESIFKLREVGKKCFDSYIQFLKTNQKNLLDVAEREIR